MTDALLKSEIQFRRLFEAAKDGILMLDAETGEITAANPFLTELLGYQTVDVLGKKLWEISPFKDATKSKILFKVLQSEEYIRYDDLPLQTRHGRLIDVEFVSNIYVSDGRRVIQCNIRDITARRAAERLRQASDERYRTLFNYAPDGIVIASRDGRYLDVNTSGCRMLGYSHDELVGLHAAALVASGEVEHVAAALREIEATSTYHGEWLFQRKDGTIFCADVRATATPDGNLLAMMRDLTARKEAERAIVIAEERMRFALDSAQIGIWDLDASTGVLQWSGVLEDQYGLARGTFGGTMDAFIEGVHPDDRAALLTVINNARRTGGDFTTHHRVLRPDGSVRTLSGAGRFINGEAGEPTRAIGISQDVTDRESLQAQFFQAQKMDAIGRLAGGVAHDFNNLLTIMLGCCEMLLDGDRQVAEDRHDIEQIQKSGLRAAALTGQLLALSRKQIIEPKILDVAAVLADMRPMLARLIREDVLVVFDVHPVIAPIKADRGQLEQVILNLAVNAQDAMAGGGTLIIGANDVELDEYYSAAHFDAAPGPHVVITVTDSGVGMSEDVLVRLYEPFFTTKDTGKGTGLGLATVHGIVAQAAGSVRVFSEPGRGSRFEVYFPQATPADGHVELPLPAAGSLRGTELLLVVEDADGLRELTKRLLERWGYSVVVAAHAADALQVFEANPLIALVLTDVVMPGLSGPDLARHLVERRPGLKVIYMSGYTDDAIVQVGVQPETAFLHKPFTANALGRKIREVLDQPAPVAPCLTREAAPTRAL
jgi:two-component system cell cycle sensor histidine kinase/response regulator CckA